MGKMIETPGPITSKDLKFMNWCIAGASIFSTCEKRNYMSIIVDQFGMVESTGYNGSPSGSEHCKDNCPRFLNQMPSGGNYDSGKGKCISLHSEVNCLFHSDVHRRQYGSMYVNGVPCYGCSKAIANSGISRLIYLNEDGQRTEEFAEGLHIVKAAGIAALAMPATLTQN